MTTKTHNDTKKHQESTKTEICQQPQFSLFSSSSISCNAFTTIFTQNSSILHLAVHNPIAFSLLQNLTRHLKPVTRELWLNL